MYDYALNKRLDDFVWSNPDSCIDNIDAFSESDLMKVYDAYTKHIPFKIKWEGSLRKSIDIPKEGLSFPLRNITGDGEYDILRDFTRFIVNASYEYSRSVDSLISLLSSLDEMESKEKMAKIVKEYNKYLKLLRRKMLFKWIADRTSRTHTGSMRRI